MTSRSTSGNGPSNAPAQPPAPAPVERLKLDPYSGPKSHHASRAFAEMQARAIKRRRRKKFALVLAALVVGGGLVAGGLFRWLVH